MASVDGLSNQVANLITIDGLTTLFSNGTAISPDSYVPYVGALGPIDLGGQRIKSSFVPTLNADLTNKFYVDRTFLSSGGFDLTSGTFVFGSGTTVQTYSMIINNVPTGTQQYLLAVDNVGNVIRGTASAGDAFLANTQTFTGVNTFSNDMILQKSFSLTLGSINNFIVRNSSAVQQLLVTNTGVSMGNLVMTGTVFNMSATSPNFIYSADSLAITASTNTSKSIILSVAGTGLTLDQYGLSLSSSKTIYCNTYQTLSGQDCYFQINGNLNGSMPVSFYFQTGYPALTTKAQISSAGVGANTFYSFASNALTLNAANGTVNVLASTMPTLNLTNGTNSLAIVSYVGGAEFRYAGTTAFGFDSTGMYADNFRNRTGTDFTINGNGSGVINLQNNGTTIFQTSVNGARVKGSSVLNFDNTPTIACDGSGFNWVIGGGGGSNVGYFDKNAWATGYGWRIHSNAFATYECAYDMILRCNSGGNPQVNANNRLMNVVVPNSINSVNDVGGYGWYCGQTVFRALDGGNQGDGIGISMSSTTGYGGNQWAYMCAVNPGVSWRNMAIGTSTAQWWVNGTACAYINSTSGWQAASDARCKRDVKDLNTIHSLQRILKCKPKAYKRILNQSYGDTPIEHKQEDIDRMHVGLIAQDVLEFNRHCVSTWEDDAPDKHEKVERLGLAYQDFIIHLIGAVQEQQKQIESLQKMLASE